MPPKGELETFYGSPWGGVDYSRPYNVIDPQFCAPGTVNTSQHSGFLTSSPWVGSLPATPFNTTSEYPIGSFKASITFPDGGGFNSGSILVSRIIVVTNLAVYCTGLGAVAPYAPPSLTLIHTWGG